MSATNISTSEGFTLALVPSINKMLGRETVGTGPTEMLNSLLNVLDGPNTTSANADLVWYRFGKLLPKGARQIAVYPLAANTAWRVSPEITEEQLAAAVDQLWNAYAIVPSPKDGVLRLHVDANFTKMSVIVSE